MDEIASALTRSPFLFVVGKGGVGKTTAACALALAVADDGALTHLLSTDPAHSIGDVLDQKIQPGHVVRSACTAKLALEALNARAHAEAWLRDRWPRLAELIENGTYLDAGDVAPLGELALPGVDEVMAALRLVELADAIAQGTIEHVVVDTAPTGHALRLLESAHVLASWNAALRAMAEKAAAVASQLTRSAVRVPGEDVLDELERTIARFERDVLPAAQFLLVARSGALVHAETARLAQTLRERNLSVAAVLQTGGSDGRSALSGMRVIEVPWLTDPRGCEGLRQWRGALRAPTPAQVELSATPPAATPVRSGLSWLQAQPWRVAWFAGKGGVGKTTCAAAAALAWSETQPTLLFSTDPAGSLGDLFGTAVTDEPRFVSDRLRVQQLDAERAYEWFRGEYRARVAQIFEQLGLDWKAALDRRVVESLFDLAPPGIDEIVALVRIVEAVEGDELLVIDSAPTGHFLRLLAMPQLALDWVHALMRILLKYGGATHLDDAVEDLLAFAKQLKSLKLQLADRSATGLLIVTLDEPVVRAETKRLCAALDHAGVPAAALIINQGGSGGAAIPNGSTMTIRAPRFARPPADAEALRAFASHWELL